MEQADVVVAGGGLAGLCVADELRQAGLRCVVLEAADEVGGRTRSRHLHGHTVDLGAEVVAPHQVEVRRLARRLGAAIRPSTAWFTHPLLWRLGGAAETARLPLGGREMLGFARAGARLAGLARGLDADAPWHSAGARELDQRTLGDWLDDQRLGSRARELAEAGSAYATVPTHELSLLHALWWVRSGGGIVRSLLAEASLHLPGGSQELARRMARRLGEGVVLGARVRAIEQDRGGVEVHAEDGRTWRGRRAVVALPLVKVREVEFSPTLDERHRRLHEELRFGRLTKIAGVCKHDPPAAHHLVVGGSPLILAERRGRLVVGYAAAGHADAPAERLLADLSACFGGPAFVATDRCRWADEPLVGGSYLACEPGQLTAHGPDLRRPHGKVHFAGNERSDYPCHMEGAIRSGRRVAELLRRELG